MRRPRFSLSSVASMTLRLGGFSVSCLSLLASAALAGCGDGGRPRQLEPGVLHGNGGSSGSSGLPSAQGGSDQGGGGAGVDPEPDAGTGGYQIGTDWDGDTTPTANNAHGIDAAAGENDRDESFPADAGIDGG